VLSGASAALLNLDRTFRIELQFLAGEAYEALSKRIDEKILACFPTESKAISLQQCEKLLRGLRDSVMCKTASRASQSTVDTFVKIINKMLLGSAPCETMKTGGHVYTSAWSKIKYFLREDSPSGDGQVFGTEALEIQFERLQEKLKSESRAAKLFELDVFKACSITRSKSLHTILCICSCKLYETYSADQGLEHRAYHVWLVVSWLTHLVHMIMMFVIGVLYVMLMCGMCGMRA
jgi:hypothetical protein